MAIAHVTLATRDVRRTARFFAETLGWQPLDRPNNIPFVAAWLSAGPAQELHLIEVPDFEPSPLRPRRKRLLTPAPELASRRRPCFAERLPMTIAGPGS